MKARARDLMTEHVIRVEPDMSLDDIGRVLCAGRHGGLPVVDDLERVVGLITETEVLNALLRGVAPETKVRDLMANPVLVVDEMADAEEAMALLGDGKVRYLPVVRQEKLVGIITPHDALTSLIERVSLPPSDRG
jgi:CBS domain-containing protein